MAFYIYYGLYCKTKETNAAFYREVAPFREYIYKKFNLNHRKKEEIITKFFQSADVYLLSASLKKPQLGDTVIMRSPLDVSQSLKTGLHLIEKLHERGCHIYIYSFSFDEEYSAYRSDLLKTLNLKFETKTRTRKTSYPLELLELGASLRLKIPPVAFADLEKHLGINRSTISMHIKRTRGAYDTVKPRPISNEEILEIQKLKESLQSRK